MALIISRQMATLDDLHTRYSYEDALDLVEVIQVNDYNEYLLMEEARRNQKQNRTLRRI